MKTMSLNELKKIRSTLRKLAKLEKEYLYTSRRGGKRVPSPSRKASSDRASSPTRRVGGQASPPTRRVGSNHSNRASSPTRKTSYRNKSPNPAGQRDFNIYCIYCKRKTKTNGLTKKRSINNRDYYAGECDICHKKKSQFI